MIRGIESKKIGKLRGNPNRQTHAFDLETLAAKHMYAGLRKIQNVKYRRQR